MEEERSEIIMPQIRREDFEDKLDLQKVHAEALRAQLEAITNDRNANYTFVIKTWLPKPKEINAVVIDNDDPLPAWQASEKQFNI